ncbi:MAG TPA: ACP S-malonyltransferase [Acidimicrobiales bacterium]|nr:ACP S-malonyltransferase [Acidimicrobiales bacterium]
MPAFVFPGQGSQRPGMGRPWRDHPSWDVVSDAGSIAGRDVAHLLLDAGEHELTETRNAQLATFVMGLVVLDAVERLGIEPTACAGHSLGEYAALVAAGAVGFEDAVRLVNERGEAMQEAAEENQGVMVALSGVDDESARIACRRADGDVWLANSNAPGECVVAGRPEETARAVAIATQMGARRSQQLHVGGAFHTPLMASAQPRLRKALEATTFYPLAVPVVANVDGMAHEDADEWAGLLSAQLRSPVRWRQSVLQLGAIMRTGEWDGDHLFCELGPGGPLSGLVRATLPQAVTMAISEPDDLTSLIARMTGVVQVVDEVGPSAHQGERLYLSERVIISPCAGIFEPPEAPNAGTTNAGTTNAGALNAGALNAGAPSLTSDPSGHPQAVAIGDLVGRVSGAEVRSPFAGELMGMLAHPGERVQAGQPIAWLRSN